MADAASGKTASKQRESSETPQRSAETGLARHDAGGTTTIDDSVVAKIASIATREVEGVADVGGAISGAIAGVVGRIRGSEHKTAGVGVEVGTREAAVDLTLKVRYPAAIHEVADSVRGNVIDRIESLTGLEVVEVNIAVTDLAFPDQDGDGDDRNHATDRVT